MNLRFRFNLSNLIILITITVFILQILSEFIFGYDLVAAWGAKINALILQGQIWRFLTPVLLHGSLLHIGFNMYALFSIGPQVEARYGKWPFIALYILSGLWGNTISFLLSPNASLGASTAIFGLIASQAVYIYQNRHLLGSAARPMLTNITIVIAVNLVLGLSPGIDNWGHLGGLIGGFLFSWFAGPSYGVETGLFGGKVLIRQEKKTALVTAAVTAVAVLFISIKFLLA